jgi:hypothetical protein
MRFRVRQLPLPLLALLALPAALGTGACSFDADLSGTSFQCTPANPHCPAGQTCVVDHCAAAPGTPDAPLAGPDAGPCDLAAQAPRNDRCDQAIVLGAAVSASGGTTVYGTTVGYADDLHPAIIATCSGVLEQGPDAVYAVDAQAGQTLTVDLSPLGFDGGIYLLDACSGSATCLGGKDVTGSGTPESHAFSIATTGRYYLVVDASAAAASGCFVLHVHLA